MRHGCRATDRGFVLFHPESVDKGPSEQKGLENFVRNVVPLAWRKVNNDSSRDGTPRPNVRSTIKKDHNAVHPQKRNKLERQQRREKTKKKEATSTISRSHSQVRLSTSKQNDENRGRKQTRRGSSAHSPLPIEEDPLVELRAPPPVFSPPVKILRRSRVCPLAGDSKREGAPDHHHRYCGRRQGCPNPKSRRCSGLPTSPVHYGYNDPMSCRGGTGTGGSRLFQQTGRRGFCRVDGLTRGG